MKTAAAFAMVAMLSTGCAHLSTDSRQENTPEGTQQQRAENAPQQRSSAVRERKVQFGNWRVDCTYEQTSFLTQCKAETYGKVTRYHGDEHTHPTPVLWVSWLKGEPKQVRALCVFGHDYPVRRVNLQVDDNTPITISARDAAGCLMTDSDLIKQLRKGRDLNVTYVRWPWGETQASFSLNKSINALNELDRLVGEQ